jgi:copper chaperone NosL
MKQRSFLLVIFFLLFCLVVPAGADDDSKQCPSCKYCGMNRGQFAFSRMLIEYDDGKVEGFCSIHCAAVDLAVHIDRFPQKILVGDFNTKQLIDAEKAFWVIGGGKPGVMTKRAKWAFATKQDAETFMMKSGGQLAGFDQAIRAAYEDMYQDSKMIREKRAAKRKIMEKHMEKEQHCK